MTVTTNPGMATVAGFGVVRGIAAALAAIVVVDAVSVGAPGLALLAVPFAIAAWRFRAGTWWGTTLLGLWSALYVLIGANYAIANGVDAGWGDLLFAYVGTPLALALLVLTVRAGLGSRSHRHAM